MEYKAAQNVHKCALRCPQKVMRLFHFRLGQTCTTPWLMAQASPVRVRSQQGMGQLENCGLIGHMYLSQVGSEPDPRVYWRISDRSLKTDRAYSISNHIDNLVNYKLYRLDGSSPARSRLHEKSSGARTGSCNGPDWVVQAKLVPLKR